MKRKWQKERDELTKYVLLSKILQKIDKKRVQGVFGWDHSAISVSYTYEGICYIRIKSWSNYFP